MALQPCCKCGELTIVETKKILSWGKARDEEKVLCICCKKEIQEIIIRK
jgi:hypothetical protein